MGENAVEAERSQTPVSLAEACERLGLAPHALRNVLDTYAAWLPTTDEGLMPDAFERLAAIWRWRAEGLSPDEIRSRLAPAAEGSDPLALLVDRLSGLQGELARTEARRVEDRDRLMMALVRTHQEIQHLRYELAASRSRKERHRGWWRRLFGA